MTEQPTLPVAEFRTPFIPAWLDDFGFTPVEFRVVCRVLRRQAGFTGGDSCWQSYPIMAGELGMHRDTLQATIRRLIEWGVLTRQQRSGKTSLLRLATPENWTRPSPLNQPALKTTGVNIGRTPPGNEGGHPPESKGYEGSPIRFSHKVLPNTGASALLVDLVDGSRERVKAQRLKAGAFTPPTREELDMHAAKMGLPAVEVEKFSNHYTANGWRVGRNPMKSWPHAMNNWKLNWQEKQNANHGNTARISSDRNRFISGSNSPECRAENAAHIARTKEENRYGPGEGPTVPAERAAV